MFYATYGVFLDSNGEPTIAPCFRMEQGLLKPAGTKPLEIGDRAQEALGQTIIDKEDGILAMRATCLTFTKNEVVGYEDDGENDDDDNTVPGAVPGGEVEDVDMDPEPAPKPARKRVKAGATPLDGDDE
jgi:hypothetical protein